MNLAPTLMSGVLAATTKLAVPHVEYRALAPFLVLVGGALLILMVSSLVGGRLPAALWTTMSVATAGISAACSVSLWNNITKHGEHLAVADAIAVDHFAVWFCFVACSCVALFSLIVDGWVQRENLPGPELHVLALCSASGAILMAFANDLLVVFLGLEILSIALYVMAGSHRRRARSGEAALKYFILGALSSAMFLYGIALTYGATGSTRLDQIKGYLAVRISLSGGDNRGLALAGMGLLLVGLGFKVAAVPFHTWTPDVYQGSPSPVTGFMAGAAKAAGFSAIVRIFVSTLSPMASDWRPLMWALAVLTLVVGSFVAIAQTDVKRMLAYSSISHAGYILVGVYANNARGIAGVNYYVLTYAFTVLGSFAVISVVSRAGDGHTKLSDFQGLYSRRPVLAVAFTLLIAAQAGVPFTTGFLAKLTVIQAAIEGEGYVIGVIAMLVTAVAAFFYLRLIFTMFTPVEADEAMQEHPQIGGGVATLTRAAADLRVPVGTGIALTISVAMTIGGGLWAGPMLDFAHRAFPLF